MSSHIDRTHGKIGKVRLSAKIGTIEHDSLLKKALTENERKAKRVRERNEKAQKKYAFGLQSKAHANEQIDILQKAPNRQGMSRGMGSQRKGSIGSARWSNSVGPKIVKPYDAKNPAWNDIVQKHDEKAQRKRNLEERRARKARKKQKSLLEAMTGE